MLDYPLRDNAIQLRDGFDRQIVADALQVALAKWGRVTMTGSLEFQGMAMDEAIRPGVLNRLQIPPELAGMVPLMQQVSPKAKLPSPRLPESPPLSQAAPADDGREKGDQEGNDRSPAGTPAVQPSPSFDEEDDHEGDDFERERG